MSSPNAMHDVLPGPPMTFQLNLCIMCLFLRGEAILLPALPIPSFSERELKDACPECPPHAFWQQPVPRCEKLVAEPGGARTPNCVTTTTTIDHLIDQDLDLGSDLSGNHTTWQILSQYYTFFFKPLYLLCLHPSSVHSFSAIWALTVLRYFFSLRKLVKAVQGLFRTVSGRQQTKVSSPVERACGESLQLQICRLDIFSMQKKSRVNYEVSPQQNSWTHLYFASHGSLGPAGWQNCEQIVCFTSCEDKRMNSFKCNC